MGMFHCFLLTKIKRFAIREKDKALGRMLHKELISRLPYSEVVEVYPSKQEHAECYALI